MTPQIRSKRRYAAIGLVLLLVLLVCGGLASRVTASQGKGLSDRTATSSSLLPPPDDYNFIHPRSVPCGDSAADLSYKVPLSPEQERRAIAVYRRSFVILAHVHCVEPWDFEEMHKAGITAVIVKVDDDGINILNGTKRFPIPAGEDWLARGTREVRRIQALAARPNSRILIARTVDDIHRAKLEGKVAVILSFEGARPLAGKLENLRHYYDLGLRELQLWWAVPNELKSADNTRFSPFGEEVIREMNRLGIVIDLSHITGKAFEEAIEISRKPLIVSHCAVGEVYKRSAPDAPFGGTDHVNDATIRAIARNRGSICVHFVTPDYIRARHGIAKATVVDLVDHIVYVRDLVGAEYVSLGADYFPEVGWKWVDGAGQMSLLPNVAREMVRRGFSDGDIAGVLGGNLVRVFRENWRNGER